MYDYLVAIEDDIKSVANDYEWGHAILNPDPDKYDTSELKDQMYEDLWMDDSVTGNGSGSYTFSNEQAKFYVTQNMSTLDDACIDFDVPLDSVGQKFLSEDWEWFDVTIRCYLLGTAIDEVLDELYN